MSTVQSPTPAPSRVGGWLGNLFSIFGPAVLYGVIGHLMGSLLGGGAQPAAAPPPPMPTPPPEPSYAPFQQALIASLSAPVERQPLFGRLFSGAGMQDREGV